MTCCWSETHFILSPGSRQIHVYMHEPGVVYVQVLTGSLRCGVCVYPAKGLTMSAAESPSPAAACILAVRRASHARNGAFVKLHCVAVQRKRPVRHKSNTLGTGAKASATYSTVPNAITERFNTFREA
jgi:hypothetical protein